MSEASPADHGVAEDQRSKRRRTAEGGRDANVPQEIWNHICDMTGGKRFWLKKYRSAVVPCIPRSVYRFSFVGIYHVGSLMYIMRYNECSLRSGLKRVARCGRRIRGRRPMMKIYEITLLESRAKNQSAHGRSG